MEIHFASAWERVAERFAQRPAVICDGRALSWQEYEERAARVATAPTRIMAGSMRK